MSLKDILDSFRRGRREAMVLYDYDAYLEAPERKISSYSKLELVSYGAGYLSRPMALYEIAKFFISGQYSGQYLGGQGIRQQELGQELEQESAEWKKGQKNSLN